MYMYVCWRNLSFELRKLDTLCVLVNGNLVLKKQKCIKRPVYAYHTNIVYCY